MDIYLVGGAVRDKLLGLPVRERDWVVVGATVEDMLALGYQQVGKDFPVFLHPDTHEEYALARTERKSGHGYRGFTVHADPDVSLEEDLKRRDLTINAMAETADGQLIDPFHGEEDLRNGLLRHVSPAFVEDPVRILRVARFAARFARWGFRVAHDTNALMRKMVDNGEIDYLVPERVWAELEKALQTDNPEKFFQVLHGCRALAVLFPEIEDEYPRQPESHSGKILIPAYQALQTAARHSSDPRVRFAVLLFRLAEGKPLPEQLELTASLCDRLKAPNEYRQLAMDVIRHAQLTTTLSPERILNLLESTRAFTQPERLQRLLDAWLAAEMIGPETAKRIVTARDRAAAVCAADFTDQRIQGPALGKAIREQRLRAIETTADSRLD